MDKITHYRPAIHEVMQGLVKPNRQEQPQYEEYDTQLVMDDERGHYYLVSVGWRGYQREHAISVHIDVKGDKVWIQADWTDLILAEQLVEKGVPKEDIVLAFHAPYRRPYTGYAVA